MAADNRHNHWQRRVIVRLLAMVRFLRAQRHRDMKTFGDLQAAVTNLTNQLAGEKQRAALVQANLDTANGLVSELSAQNISLQGQVADLQQQLASAQEPDDFTDMVNQVDAVSTDLAGQFPQSDQKTAAAGA